MLILCKDAILQTKVQIEENISKNYNKFIESDEDQQII